VSPMTTRRIRSAGLLGIGAMLLTIAATTPARADSYRLRDKDLGAPSRSKSADFA
jgi:hypothetical protein